MHETRATAVTCLAALALLALGAAACGSAQAEPLEVTYYYLPG